MKKLNLFDKSLFLLNLFFAGALLFSYLLPYIPPQKFALLSVLSLGVPLLLIINIGFLIFWLLRLKRQFLLSLIVLIIGYNHLTSIYEISGIEESSQPENGIGVLSYNVQYFNQYLSTPEEREGVQENIAALIKNENPDIVALQEYYAGETEVAPNFPYKYVKMKEKSAEFGLGIFSRHPIIKTKSLDFHSSSNNNAVYADILIEEDTVRIINVHLQSFSLKPEMTKIEKESSKKVFLGMGQTFAIQQQQIDLILELIKDTRYPYVLMGDFNNTAYSYIYRKLIDANYGPKDAYKEIGQGFGRTFDFDYFPLRIDYIMPAKNIEVLSFKTIEVFYSDHFPIKATLKL